MNNERIKSLEKTYEALINVALQNHPLSEISTHINDNFMGYGSALDEKLHGWGSVKWMIERQRNELRGQKSIIKRYPVDTTFLSDDLSALIVEEIEITVDLDDEINGFTLRLSTLLEYVGEKWMIRHFHGSTADADTPEGSAWPIEEWKRRNAELQRAVEVKTAELQNRNRELETEASLERVRSRAMAMRSSDELSDLIITVFQELQKLDMQLTRCLLWIFDEKDRSASVWMTNSEDPNQADRFHVPDHKHPAYKSFLKGWDTRQTNWEYELKGKDKDDWNEILVHGYFKKLPAEIKNAMKDTERVILSGSFNEYGVIQTTGLEKLSDQNQDILFRFSQVFEQTYTRFLDLQKAENQAREAQIEAALERVRSKSMAMHKSEELADLSLELVKQVQALGVPSWFCAFNIYDDDSLGSLEWGSNGEGTFPKYRTPREGIFLRYYEAGQRGETFLVHEIGEDECPAHYEYLCSLPGVGEQLLKMKAEGIPFPTSQIDHVAFFKYGYLLFITYDPAPETHDIFKRFARVFEQTYTRFLDLQKAEEQAREARIEAALERVRSKAMTMHSSEDLSQTVDTFFSELALLNVKPRRCGVGIIDRVSRMVKMNATATLANKNTEIVTAQLTLSGHPVLNKIFDSWILQKEYYPILKGKEIQEYYQAMNPEVAYPDIAKNQTEYGYYFFFKEGGVFAWTNEGLSQRDIEIFRRFNSVLSLTYRRYIDLIEAEEQAREAQIEAALERVRSRSMAMQKSEELKEVIQIVFDQMVGLDIHVEHTGFIIDYDTRDDMLIWLADPNGAPSKVQIPYFDSPHWNSFLDSKGKGIDEFTNLLDFEEKNKFYNQLFEHIPELSEETMDHYLKCPGLAISTVLCENVGLYMENFSGTPYTEEENKTLMRFGKVFQQTYTRFLDLQKAEAQAREAQIELALERIRAQVTAMQESNDLLDIVVTMRDEFVNLDHDAHYFWHMRWLPDKYVKAMTSGDGTRIGMVMSLPRHIHGDIKLIDDWEKSDKPIVIYPMDVDTALDYVHKMISLGDFEQIDPNAPSDDDIRHIGGLTFIMARTTHGEIGYSLPGVVEDLPREDLDTLIRFSAVFDLAYIRFEDLRESELQKREAEIELALERVRARTMAMQHSDELPQAANNLFLQVQALGIPAWSAGYCIWENENRKSATAFMSSEGVLQKPFSLPTKGVGYDFYSPLQKGETLHIEELGGEEIVRHYEFMRTLPVFGEVIDGIIEAGFPLPTFQIFHILYFPQGYLMFITYEAVPEAHDIFKRFAKVFEQTYTRFLDLQKAEEQSRMIKEERDRLDATLTDLKATQAQLIQSEKMASLGELTAGIAHEIQNPLNFVNNFSEINTELIQEIKEERVKSKEERDVGLEDEILVDLEQNMEKINHHGKRADAIVKGMLQHSRTSTGEKVPTDINELADEYLRLAYHGLRAKDSFFNAEFEADLDPNLPKVNVIPQDIGRVLLNLINNAFQACAERSALSLSKDSRSTVDEKSKLRIDGYAPKVTVKTRVLPSQEDDGALSADQAGVEIIVKDNGPGIPEDIMDKIFQPFFTTKPTGQGTGLGLSLSYDIVKAHRGELKMESIDQEGTEFIIVLPIN